MTALESVTPLRARVLLLITSTAGGAGLHAYLLSRHLPREHYDLTVAFGPGYSLDARFDTLEVPVRRLSFSRRLSPWKNLVGLIQVIGILRRERFDMVIMETSVAGFAGRVAGALTGVPLRVLVVQVYASRPFQNPVKRAIYRWIERALDSLTTRYVAVSEATRRYGVATGIMPHEKVDVVYNAVEFADKRPVARSRARECLGLRQDVTVIGTLSRCEEQKGLKYLIKTAALVLKETDSVQFVIVGDGPLKSSLMRLSDQFSLGDHVVFAGWHDDVVTALSSMDIYCMASLWEQAPLAIAEAMAMELPVVATAVDGVPEMIISGENGLLVPPRDPAALADGLLELITDPQRAKRMGKAGRLRAQQRFSIDQMILRYDHILWELFTSSCVKSRTVNDTAPGVKSDKSR